jgi:hypothetical protein
LVRLMVDADLRALQDPRQGYPTAEDEVRKVKG